MLDTSLGKSPLTDELEPSGAKTLHNGGNYIADDHPVDEHDAADAIPDEESE